MIGFASHGLHGRINVHGVNFSRRFKGESMNRYFAMAVASAMALSLGGLGAATAADLPVYAKAPPPPVVVYNWTGCYVGGNVGWKWGRFHESADTPAGVAVIPGLTNTAFTADHIDLGGLNTDSVAGGGQLGCRWETASHWVFGVEGDFDWTDLHGTVTERSFGTGGSVFIPGDSYGNRARWESSVRGMVGRSFGKWLIYATGGLAITDVRMSANYIATVAGGVPFPASTGSDSQTLYGFTVGAGAAYALTNNWDIGAEYRYSQYSGANFGLGSVAAVCGFTTAVPGGVGCFNTQVTGHKDLSTNEVLFKLNYRFGPAAVVAKY
jgi:outer membrane immunogenic protein